MSKQQLAHKLVAALQEKRTGDADFGMKDLSAIVEQMIGEFLPESQAMDQAIHDEIEAITTRLGQMRAEFLPSSSKEINEASTQLDAVLKTTEQAANTIMDACDEIQKTLGQANTDTYVEKKIGTAVTQIYEACNFQDLTGQRIRKALVALGETEVRMKRLLALWEGKEVAPLDLKPDDPLLAGPQNDAPSQGDIDALFDSLK